MSMGMNMSMGAPPQNKGAENEDDKARTGERWLMVRCENNEPECSAVQGDPLEIMNKYGAQDVALIPLDIVVRAVRKFLEESMSKS